MANKFGRDALQMENFDWLTAPRQQNLAPPKPKVVPAMQKLVAGTPPAALGPQPQSQGEVLRRIWEELTHKKTIEAMVRTLNNPPKLAKPPKPSAAPVGWKWDKYSPTNPAYNNDQTAQIPRLTNEQAEEHRQDIAAMMLTRKMGTQRDAFCVDPNYYK